MAELYHNPRCSKSRQAMKILNDSGIDFSTVEYLKTDVETATIMDLLSRYSGEICDFVRTGDDSFKQTGYSLDDLNSAETISQLIADIPKILQRPIFDDGTEVFIGRPPENIYNSKLL